ncbi:Rne/Rng family ribonuclease [Dermacoccaceae bacterium W4C1]
MLFQAPDPTTVAPAREPEPAARGRRDDKGSDADGAGRNDSDSSESGSGHRNDDSGDDAGEGRSRRRRGGRGRKSGGDSATHDDAGSSENRDDDTTSDDDSGDSSGNRGKNTRSGSRSKKQTKGGRGNGSDAGSGSDSGSNSDSDADQDEDSNGPDASGDADSGDGEGTSSSRRRRRRRRSGSGGGESDDPPGTVTKVREPRRGRDEVTSIKGSTRLEAKKQRRREGREAGRRRTVITEAEFLARRESVDRQMVVRESEGRTQIGVLEDGVLVEHYVSQDSQSSSMAGNVYLGRVQNVLPSMEAAFVDVGRGRNAVLYAGEVNWDAAGLEGKPKRIENALKSGSTVLVQVTKDPIGHKGARLTSQISLPGRYLVYVPGNSMTGISRKLPDTERARLKKILKEVVPENAGVIVRTAAEGASEEELRADVERLTQAWEKIEKKASSSSASAPSLLRGESEMTVRVIRDVFNEDFSKLVVSGDNAWNQISSYLESVAPDLAQRAQKWTGEKDAFAVHRIDEQLAKAMDRKVWLPSGGSLIIDRTEAMTVIDVNTGKFVGSGGNLEETVTKNNLEAAEEIVRQLRLRDIGGIIVVDYIDMVLESNRDLVVRRMLECLGRDRTKHQVAEVTSLGLVQMTRKRVGTGLLEVFSEPCEHCNGRGVVVHDHPVDKGGNSGSNGNSNGGGSNGGSGNGRGRKGRGRSNGSGGSGSEQQSNAEQEATENKVDSNGRTAAQIAAAAHAAAMSKGERKPSEDVQSAKEVESAEDVESSSGPEVVTEAAEAAPEAVAEPAVRASAADEAAAAPETPEPAAPKRSARRRRGRVVAAAGPPGGAAPAAAEPSAPEAAVEPSTGSTASSVG